MLNDELAMFYKRVGFGEVIGSRPLMVPVYTGCMLVPLPNIEARHRYLKYHDLHHLVTGYSVGRIGEGEVSAWELGTGSAIVSPLLGLMNLIALSTGIVLEPRRMWRAFQRGCLSRNIYKKTSREAIDANRYPNVDALKQDLIDTRRPTIPVAFRFVEFACYCGVALIVHACIAIPALIVRFITDLTLGMNVFQAIKPKKRADLY